MATIILVHGAFSNKESWFDVPAALKAEGHSVIVNTLPGHVLNQPLPIGIGSMKANVAAVTKTLPAAEKAWLVGHSMGGMVISQVAANAPTQVAGLIYIAAVLPTHGDTTIGLTGLFDFRKSFENHNRPDIKKAFSNQPPLAPFAAFSTSPGFKTLPKHYFHCTQDKVIVPPKQDRMVKAYPETDLRILDSDHLPMHISNRQPDAFDGLMTGLKDIVPS